MIEFMLAKQNLPFTVSIGMMLFIAFIEGAGAVMGFGFSDFLDSMIPDLDMDVDTPDIDSSSGFTKLLGWLRIGKVPVMALIIVFLTSFGLIGLITQTVSENVTGGLLPGALASIVAFLLSIPVVRGLGGIISKVMPQDETDAVSEASFIGRTATIVLGKARCGSPAQAKLKDQHGTTHYIMVEPDIENSEFESGTSVLIVSHGGSVYKVILNTNPALSE